VSLFVCLFVCLSVCLSVYFFIFLCFFGIIILAKSCGAKTGFSAEGGDWTIKSTSRKTPLTSPERPPQPSRPGTLRKPAQRAFSPERRPGNLRKSPVEIHPPAESPESRSHSLRPAVARPLGGWQARATEDGPAASFFEPSQIRTHGIFHT
jgi:hypothetical protein